MPTATKGKTSSTKPKYRRVLLKLSGEALAGTAPLGIDYGVVGQIAQDIKAVHDAGVQRSEEHTSELQSH